MQLFNVKYYTTESFFKYHMPGDCNGTWTSNYLVREWTLKHLVKITSLVTWLYVDLPIKWLWALVPLQ